MVDDDINNVFEKIRKHFEGKSESEHKMFHILVDTTLKYRDELNLNGEAPLTVDETRIALDNFMIILLEKRFPENIPERVKNLVVRWLEELKKRKQN